MGFEVSVAALHSMSKCISETRGKRERAVGEEKKKKATT
jgi:hypothetical protein